MGSLLAQPSLLTLTASLSACSSPSRSAISPALRTRGSDANLAVEVHQSSPSDDASAAAWRLGRQAPMALSQGRLDGDELLSRQLRLAIEPVSDQKPILLCHAVIDARHH
jgi:hypothetical protein